MSGSEWLLVEMPPDALINNPFGSSIQVKSSI